MSTSRFEPKLITVLKEGYSLKLFSRDLVAGFIVGIIALPLSIALAIASGVKPEQGLYTAVIAGFLISAFSGSRVQIGGPTGAFIVLVYSIVQQHGYEGLAIATLMAGALLVCMGIARLGGVIKFIPYPVTVGFTSGIAVIICAAQIRDFFGLDMPAPPADFIEKMAAYIHHAGSVNPHALGMGVASYLLITYWPRMTQKVPASLIAIIVATTATSLLQLPVETIGSRFGSIPATLPVPQFPALRWELISQLFPAAFAIAMLAGIESLLSAVVADGMTGRRHRSNTELVAQGIANIVSPIFQGLPATGAIARTAANIKNGGVTPFSGIIHAITLLLIMVMFGKWAVLIPMPVLAAILMRVAYNMGEWHLFGRLFRSPKSDVLVLLSTFGLTILVDLIVAIEVGVVMAAFLFMKRMSEVTHVGFIDREVRDDDRDPAGLRVESDRVIPADTEVFEIYGPFFFGATDRFKDAMRELKRKPKALILRMRHVPVIDATGMAALEDVLNKCRREKTQLILSGVHPQPRTALERAGLIDKIGEENIQLHFDAALNRARIISGAA
ncbi:MAG TPA: sulfate permease [Kiritimatiellia bacterium]|nr:sulfate permease [Kiritimatiellia bacterium]